MTKTITWIPVTNPPPEGTRCLLWAGGELKTGTYKDIWSMEAWTDDCCVCGDGGPYSQAVEDVTHWALFPEGPSEPHQQEIHIINATGDSRALLKEFLTETTVEEPTP